MCIKIRHFKIKTIKNFPGRRLAQPPPRPRWTPLPAPCFPRRLDASPQTKILPTPLTLSLFVPRFTIQTILINVTICCVFILLWTFTIMVCSEKKVKKRLPETGKQLCHSSRAQCARCNNSLSVVSLNKQFTVL